MCVIIAIPKGEYLDKELAADNWKINPDGGGFAYHDGESFVVYKSMEFKDFWGAFERARSENRDKDFLVHMRIATHGSVDLDNVHPFLSLDGNCMLAHNGILKKVPDYKDGRSDTRVFVDEVLPLLPEAWYRNDYLNDMVGSWIDWNKFVVLDADGVWVVNWNLGSVHNGMWFSNSYALPFGKNKPKKSTIVRGNWRKTGTVTETYVPSGWDDVYDDYDNELWWAKNKDSLASGGVVKGNFEPREQPLATNSSQEAKAEFLRLREDDGFFHPLDWDKTGNRWYCMGCLDDIQDGNGECSCYELMDKVCGELLGFCECGFDVRQPQELDADWNNDPDGKFQLAVYDDMEVM